MFNSNKYRHTISIGICVIFWLILYSLPPGVAQVDSLKRKGIFVFSVEDVLNLPVEVSEPIVVTASRLAQKQSEAPANIYIITAEQIRNRGYFNLLDILGDIVEYKTEQYGNSTNFNDITTRGIRGQLMFIILLNGIRISSPTNENLPIVENFPIRSAKQIEIVTSPASSVYGADAIAGVINIITYKPEELNSLQATIYGGLYNQWGGNIMAGKKWGNLGIFLSGHYHYDELPNFSKFYPDRYQGLESLKTGSFYTAFGPMTPRTPVSPEYGHLLAAYNLQGIVTYGDISLTIHRNYTRFPSSIYYTPNNAVYNSNAFIAPSVTMGSMAFTRNFGRLYNFTNLTYSEYYISPYSNYRNLYSGMEPGYKFGMGNMFQLEQQNAYNFSSRISLGWGFSFQNFFAMPRGDDLDRVIDPNKSIQANINGTPFPATFYTMRYSNTGAYTQIIYKPFSKWVLTAGARFDYNTRYRSLFNPRVGMVYLPSKNTNLKLFYGAAFLAPPPWRVFEHYGTFFPIDDSAKVWKSAFWQLPNTNLGPVTAHCVDFIVKQKLSDLNIYFSVYHIWLANLFFRVSDAEYTQIYNGQYQGKPVDYIQVNINGGEQRNYGGTLGIEWQKKLVRKNELRLSSALGYVEGQQIFDGTIIEIPYISTLQYRAIAEWFSPKFSVVARVIAMNAQRTVATTDKGDRHLTLPGYWVLHLSAGYQIFPYLRLGVHLVNVTDQRYYNVQEEALVDRSTHLGMPQNPFRIVFSVDYNFNLKK
ncbi:MAG: TonB-dependent receptor [Bacteroidia bacterium]|nr:TonB-dependent receptor [Bacteroidia bacterium]